MRNLVFLSFLILLTGCVKSNPDQIQIVKGDKLSMNANFLQFDTKFNHLVS